MRKVLGQLSQDFWFLAWIRANDLFQISGKFFDDRLFINFTSLRFNFLFKHLCQTSEALLNLNRPQCIIVVYFEVEFRLFEAAAADKYFYLLLFLLFPHSFHGQDFVRVESY